MKRQLLLSLTLSMLASTAFALPAADQATPQVKSSHSVFSQTVAADGGDRTPQGQTLAEGGRDRLEEKGLVQDGYDKTPQGQIPRTPQGRLPMVATAPHKARPWLPTVATALHKAKLWLLTAATALHKAKPLPKVVVTV
jgi:hypothetical protein